MIIDYDSHLKPTPLETASGVILGTDEAVPPLPPPNATGPLGALKAALLGALRTSPCMVSFSGGRDSSCVLAMAVQLAREEGLPLPVPITYRFRDAPEVDESYWQDLVIRHLHIDDWIRIEIDDELDYVGPIAQRALRLIGLRWPPNGHMILPALDRARGGTLVTGLDGDGLFMWRWSPAVNLLLGRRRPDSDALKTLASYLAPTLVARTADRFRKGQRLPWLLESARRELWTSWNYHQAQEPRTWAKRLHYYNRMRYVSVLRSNATLLARSCESKLLHLFMDPQFLANLAAADGRLGFRDRTTSMKGLFDGVVPTILLERTDKPIFHVYWGSYSKRLADEWEGEGVDLSRVDPSALFEDWHSAYPSFRSVLLLQSAWLARNHVEQPVEAPGQ